MKQFNNQRKGNEMSKRAAYLETGTVATTDTKSVNSKMSVKVLDSISTGRIIWHLIKRHKFGLVCTWAIVMTVSYMFPPIWDIFGSMFL